MENAAEALKMAGSVLMFMIALTVSIIAFGQARQTADTVMYNLDRETTYIDGDYYYKAVGTTRQVGLETVIPTIMRVFNESYEIEFDFKNENPAKPIYTIKSTSGAGNNEVYRIKENDFLSNDVDGKKIFLKAIIYGIKTQEEKENFNKYYGNTIDLPTLSLYDRLKNATITEEAGEYKKTTGSDAKEKNVRVIKYVIK